MHGNSGAFHAQRMGITSAALSLLFGIAYSVFALLSVFGRMPFPHSLFWQFLPSLLLAFAFVVTMVCLHFTAPILRRVYTAIGVAFAVVYCVCATIVYFIQMAVVLRQHPAEMEQVNPLLAFSDGSVMVALDCIGYVVMSLSALFAAFAFKSQDRGNWLYRSLLYHGLLAPFVLTSFFIPSIIYIGALWMITLPMVMINATKWFAKNIGNNLNGY